jgi:hypothetical protein
VREDMLHVPLSPCRHNDLPITVPAY